jgi:hypothetical protein
MRIVRTLRLLAGLLVFFVAAPARAQIQLAPVVSGLDSPVFVTNAGDNLGRLFIVEQPGVIRILQPGSSTATVFLDIQSKIISGGERGLLGLAFHPQYAANGRFFVFYTRALDGALVISEFVASPANANTAGTAERVILTIPHPTNANHNGGMLAFGPDGYLYIGVGDGGSANDPPNNAQNKNVLLGKILRIDVNSGTPYGVPSDNPFVGAIDGRDEIFAYGMRNPWRFSFDRLGGQQWVGDVGQGSREEVDTPILSGGNYGWRIFEGTLCTGQGSCANPEDYIFPVFDYSHLNGRCSLTGGYVYRGAQGAVTPGTYVYGDYCSGEIFAWDGATQTVLLDTAMNISSFGEDEDGEIYVADLGGSVSRIIRAAACTYAISPARASYGNSGGSGAVTVTAPAGCAWTATSNVGWITVTGGSGTGNGTVNYSVATYTGKPKKRNGTVTVAGQTFMVQQTR